MAASSKFGRHLKAARALADITQSGVADSLSRSGVDTHPTTVSLWESGRRSPTLEQFVLLCREFGWEGDARKNLESMLLNGEGA